MASISILSGFDYKGRNYDFTRQGFQTIETMAAFSENYLPPVYIATNEEDGGVWIYNIGNTVDDVTGKWRRFEGGSGDLMNYFTKNEINTLLATKVDVEVGKGLSTNDFTDEDKTKLDSLENYDDTEIRTLINTNTSAITTINTKIGSDVLQTLAQTLTGAINELKVKVDDTTLADMVAAINAKIGNAVMQTTAQTITGAINELKAGLDDTTLADRVTVVENAIDILNGDDSVVGSVAKAVLDAVVESKEYTDEQIASLGETDAILCDAQPTYNPSTNKITYVKDGTETTIDASMIWFYFMESNQLKQSILINGQWTTIVSAGGVNFADFVSKSKDVVSTYTGTEVITDKIPNVAALQALQNIIDEALSTKVNTADIIDGLTSTATDKPLSANQGKVLNEALNTKLDKVFDGADVGNKPLKTDANGEVVLGDYDSSLDTASTNAVQNQAVAIAMNTKLDKNMTEANKVLKTDSNGDVVLGDYDDAIDPTSTNAVQNTAVAAALNTKVDIAQGTGNENKILGTDANGDVVLKDPSVMGADAENVSYENEAFQDLTNVKLALDTILAEIYYVEPKIESFTMTPATTEYEIGQSVPSVSFSWAVNKTISAQTLTDCTVTVEDRSASYDTPISSNKTFTLTIGDGKKTASSSKSIAFRHKIYWGNAVQPAQYDSEFILGLSGKKLMSSAKGTYSFNAGAGEYCYFAMPQSMKFTSAWVNGFNTELETVANAVSFTNASGNTSTFSIVRFAQASLGSFTAEVK